MKNLINCGTCGYPLTPEERTSLIECDGVMVKPEHVQEPVMLNGLTEAETNSSASVMGLTKHPAKLKHKNGYAEEKNT